MLTSCCHPSFSHIFIKKSGMSATTKIQPLLDVSDTTQSDNIRTCVTNISVKLFTIFENILEYETELNMG